MLNHFKTKKDLTDDTLRFFKPDIVDFSPLDSRIRLIKEVSNVISGVDWFYDLEALTPDARAFIKSTMKFIATGERDVPVTGWRLILFHGRAEKPIYDRNKYISLLEDIRIPKSRNMIMQSWIEKPGGYLDMYMSLAIIINISMYEGELY